MSWVQAGRRSAARAAGIARRRTGHRGAFLLAVGLFDEVYALGIPSVTGANGRWLAHIVPLDAWAALWAAVGLVLLVGAFTTRDGFAFGAAISIKLLWSMVELAGWADGVPRAWVSVALWTWAAAVVLIIAVWPERQWPVG